MTSSTSSNRDRYNPKYTEICVGNISATTEPNDLLAYFEQFGSIIQYTFTSPTGGYVFITYKDYWMVDECMKRRRHHLNGRHLYVKRALPVDDEHPRERFETTRDLMIVIDFDHKDCDDEEFLSKLRDYFSSYGPLYACKYCHEINFRYILVEFADKDQVDRIILDKPHYYHEHQLNVMKFISSNVEMMNSKYASNKQLSSRTTDIIDNDDNDNNDHMETRNRFNAVTKEPISERVLENEVYRLQTVLKQINEDFECKRQQFEEQWCKQLKKLELDTNQTICLQRDLEQEYARLLVEYESVKRKNQALNEEYLAAELENFEITSYYEQILAEEKTKTAQLEDEYTQILRTLDSNRLSPLSSSCHITGSSLSEFPQQQTISGDG